MKRLTIVLLLVVTLLIIMQAPLFRTSEVKYETSNLDIDEVIRNINIDELDLPESYEIIRFSPSGVNYKPKSLELDFLDESFVNYDEVEIPMGKSRIGGPVVDLPKDIEYPEGMYLAAQLNFEEISKLDDDNIYPSKGYLYVFVDDYLNGQVLYSDCKTSQLHREIREHDSQFFFGMLVDKFYKDTETLEEKYSAEWADKGEDLGWDYFSGFEKSKLGGMYNDCQMEKEEVYYIMSGSKVLLLQIGEDFTDEGILNVLIDEEDLKNRRFDQCTVEWSQS